MEKRSLQRLIAASRFVTAEPDSQRALEHVIGAAREVTRARYGVLLPSDDGTKMTEAVSSSLDVRARQALETALREIGPSAAITPNPTAIRLADIREHPRFARALADTSSLGAFLGVPIFIDGRAWGALYLVGKDEGDFTEIDEQAALVFGGLASVAIDHAELVDRLTVRPAQVRRELRRGEAMVAVARALGEETGLQQLLERIVEEGREFSGARALLLFLRVGDLLVEASASPAASRLEGALALPLEGSVAGEVLRSLRAARLQGEAEPGELGLRRQLGASVGLLVPVSLGGRAVGLLAAFDRVSDGPGFDAEDEQLLWSFAASAATAIVTAQLIQGKRAQDGPGYRDHERSRIARELHDETLQALGVLRITLSAALHTGETEELVSAVESAVARLDQEIEELRRLIEGLRPTALDALGLEGAISALGERTGAERNLEVETHVELAELAEQLHPDIEHALYRLVQEALRNVVKHAGARQVDVDLRACGPEVELRVTDDGRGFGALPGRIGFGLLGMQERVERLGGRFELAPSQTGGTTVRARLPLNPPVPEAPAAVDTAEQGR